MSVYSEPSEAVGWLEKQQANSAARECVAISIVSNSRLMGEGMIGLLHRKVIMTSVNVYAGGDVVAAEASAIPFDAHVVLIDYGLGVESAAAWTRFWRERQSTAHIIVFDMVDDCDTAVYVKVGADGYTTRGATIAELAETIQMVQRGEARHPSDNTSHLFARMASLRASSASVPITPRELEVLACVADGLSNQEIAAQLVIEVRTVKHHLHNILDKLQVRSRWQAVRVARERSWIPTQRVAHA